MAVVATLTFGPEAENGNMRSDIVDEEEESAIQDADAEGKEKDDMMRGRKLEANGGGGGGGGGTSSGGRGEWMVVAGSWMTVLLHDWTQCDDNDDIYKQTR